MTSLYVCYQGVREPLTQTQVVAYLEGLARAGWQIVLLTFEPRALSRSEVADWRRRLAVRGIIWHWLRYHKRPTAPATALDIATGILVGRRLAGRYGVRLVHARGHVAGVIGLALQRLTGARFLFDIRGFMAEEYVDAGTWPPGGALYRATKRTERRLVEAADGYVVLAKAAVAQLAQWYPREMRGKPIEVIPCCVDLRLIPRELAVQRRVRENGMVLAYVGKLGGTYPVREMAAFAAVALEAIPELRWQVWTQSDATALRQSIAERGLGSRVSIGQAPPEVLLRQIAAAHAGLCLYQRTLSGTASSPTKVGEYLGAGLPVICSAGVGDVDRLLADQDLPEAGSDAGDDHGHSGRGPGATGMTLPELSEPAYRAALPGLRALLQDATLPERCREVAEEQLDLQGVGWTRYRRVYDRVA